MTKILVELEEEDFNDILRAIRVAKAAYVYYAQERDAKGGAEEYHEFAKLEEKLTKKFALNERYSVECEV